MGGRPNLVYSPGPGLWTWDLGPSGPDLGPGPEPELDNNESSGPEAKFLFPLLVLTWAWTLDWHLASGMSNTIFSCKGAA